MKKVTGILLVMFMYGFSFHTALAQDGKTALVPLPSVDDFTRGNDGWSIGLGLGVEYESAYEGSDEFEFEVDPAGADDPSKSADPKYLSVASTRR